ncbi:hypothetical protein ABEB36_011699 [Hypothenemus hampei]|uniref:Fatty acid desaturase domain-containing protein n=1 Tax=Hypothenemus hampei TaxID=57062 RepID=A0ABD1E8Q9_HYPHA
MVINQNSTTEVIFQNPNLATSQKSKNEKYKCIFGEFETQIYWGNLTAMIVIHFIAFYALFKWSLDLKLKPFIYNFVLLVLGGFGITGGAHRYFTHRCYKATLPLKLILLLCYSISGQNNLLNWVRDHRVHHKYSETNADPHNANRGFLFAHCGWLCMKKHPEVIRKGKQVDVSDITLDPLLAFHIRHWVWFKLFFCYILPPTLESWLFSQPFIVCMGHNVVRYILNLHATWSVNSVAHIWGNKPYNKHIQPTENPFVSFIAMGEGWHNYHHTFPCDYRTSELGTNLNWTASFIDVFAKIGWAYELKTTVPDLVKSIAKNKGDGTYNFNDTTMK